MKDDTLELVKFRTLKRMLGAKDCLAAGVLECLWIFARKNALLGDVGKFSNEEIAAAIEWEGDANALVAALTDSKWLDEAPGQARLVCRDWYDHAPSYIVRRINNLLRVGDTRTPTDAGRDAWRLKMFGRAPGTIAPDVGAVETEKRPDGAQSEPKTAPLAYARKPSPTQPSPTPPSPARALPAADSAPDVEPLTATWEGVVGDLLSAGVEYARAACESARANGVLPSEAAAVVRHYLNHPGAWGPALLYAKVKNMREGSRIAWPEPSADYQRETQRAAVAKSSEDATTKSRRERAEAEKLRLSELAEIDSLESLHGERVDKIPRKELRKMIETQWPDRAVFLIASLPAKGVPPGVLRTDLMKHFASTADNPLIL